MKYLSIYLIVINALALLFMLADKGFAKKRTWRIPERSLLMICAIGGSLGGLLGMMLFRHKTRHLTFTVSIPIMLALHVAMVLLLRTILP